MTFRESMHQFTDVVVGIRGGEAAHLWFMLATLVAIGGAAGYALAYRSRIDVQRVDEVHCARGRLSVEYDRNGAYARCVR